MHGGELRFPLGPARKAIGLPEMSELVRTLWLIRVVKRAPPGRSRASAASGPATGR